MEEREAKIALRSLIWGLCFYGMCAFCVIYLTGKTEIVGADAAFVFAPLVFLAFSSECLRIAKFKRAAAADLCIRAFAFILSQLVFRRIADGAYLWVCLGGLIACFAFSLASSIIIYLKVRR